jgi:hypothetical protein
MTRSALLAIRGSIKLLFCFKLVLWFAGSFSCFGRRRDQEFENKILTILIPQTVN